MAILKTIGENVRRHRERLKWSQEKLAEEAELHSTYISGIEGGVRNVSALNIERIAKALHLKADQLLLESVPRHDETG